MVIDQGGFWVFGIFAAIWVLFSLALLVLIVLGIVWLVRRLQRDSQASGSAALDELQRRYALGEIDRDTFLRMRDDLTAGRGR
jgi:putative membrane protein